jgi:hypothetical protein
VSVSSANRSPAALRPVVATTVATNITNAVTQGDRTKGRSRRGAHANSPAATTATAVPGIPLTQ